MIVANIYKGNLIASLAFSPKLPFSTLEEVASDTQYTILMVNDSSQKTLLEVSSQHNQLYMQLVWVWVCVCMCSMHKIAGW